MPDRVLRREECVRLRALLDERHLNVVEADVNQRNIGNLLATISALARAVRLVMAADSDKCWCATVGGCMSDPCPVVQDEMLKALHALPSDWLEDDDG